MTSQDQRRSLVPTQVKWDTEGTIVEGMLVDKEETVYQGNTRGRYLMDTMEGMKVFLGGFILDQALRPVKVGTCIGVKYLGQEEKGRGENKLKLFEVWEMVVANEVMNQATQEEQEKAVSGSKK